MEEARRAAELAARTSYGRLVSILTRRVGDPAAAEDALASAFAAALERWPRAGVPDAPEAWLLTAARREIGHLRRHDMVRNRSAATLAVLADEAGGRTDAPLGDDRLALMFVCAHPAIDAAVQAPLMLQMVLGLDATRIASCFLVSPSAIGQRLVRAKRRISEAGIAFEVPEGEALSARLEAVLAAIYASFGTGWNDLSATDSRTVGLAEEAIWLGRTVVSLMPSAPEPRGLLALMLYCHARRAARRSASGAFVPLSRQDTALWNHAAVAEAERLLAVAARAALPGRYQIEAAIQSLHVEHAMTGRAPPQALQVLYDMLVAVSPTIGARVARAGAMAEAGYPREALTLLGDVAGGDDYQPWWAARARAQFLAGDDAECSLSAAIGLTSDPAVRDYLLAGGNRDPARVSPRDPSSAAVPASGRNRRGTP